MTPLDRIAHVIDLGAYRLAAVMIRLYVDDTLEAQR